MSPEVKTGIVAFGITAGGASLLGFIVLGVAAPKIALATLAILLCVLFVLGSVGGLIALIVSITGIGTECPECGKKWAKVIVRSKIVEQKKCYGLVSRSAYSRSSGSISGTTSHSGSVDHCSISGTTHSSGSTSWEERVPVIRTTYLMYYKCKYCYAKWTEEKVKEVEDFDIERE